MKIMARIACNAGPADVTRQAARKHWFEAYKAHLRRTDLPDGMRVLISGPFSSDASSGALLVAAVADAADFAAFSAADSFVQNNFYEDVSIVTWTPSVSVFSELAESKPGWKTCIQGIISFARVADEIIVSAAGLRLPQPVGGSEGSQTDSLTEGNPTTRPTAPRIRGVLKARHSREETMADQSIRSATTRTRNPTTIIAICGLMILFDGYDLIVYGAVAPALLGSGIWELTPAMVGRAASLTLLGMLLGALFAGTLADRIGRRKVILGSLASFSVMMIASGLASNFLMFETTRFLAGLGLGALFPTVTALIIEFSPPHRKAMAFSQALLGYLIGGICSGILGILLIQSYGWRPLMIIGGLPILLMPVFMRMLPESPEWLASKGRQAEADAISDEFGLPRAVYVRTGAKVGVGALFSAGRMLPTLNAWGIHFCSLLLTFGMVNWLPTIMNKMGYDISSALLFSVVLNCGAAAGLLLGARIADRGNVKIVVAGMFAIGALAIWGLTFLKGAEVYLLVALAGTGTIGTQILANVLIGGLYPVQIRGTGLGFSLGIGRIGGMIGPAIGGAVLQRQLPPEWNFYIFAAVAVVGCLLALMTLLHPQRETAS